MIPLKCIVEYAILQGQSYDLGQDFANFKKTIDGTNEQIKQRYEQAINNKLKGKRIRARAARGFKQVEKDFEFDVSRVTIDDYYDNFVVIAHDESGSKPKEYFLKPGSNIQIIGPVSQNTAPTIQPPVASPVKPKVPTPPSTKPSGMMKEDDGNDNKEKIKKYDAYSIESIIDDITPWIRIFMKDTRLEVREFVKSLGWIKHLTDGRSIAVYDLTIPVDSLKVKLNDASVRSILSKISAGKPINNNNITSAHFDLIKFDPQKDVYKIRIKKTMTRKNNKPEKI